MSRDNFISDHLVDMRAQLRDSYENFHQNREPEHSEHEKTQVPETAATEEPVGKYLPTIRKSNENSDADRERRDLEGRIIHDLAAVDRERELLQEQLAELEKFAEVLADSREKLESPDFNQVRLNYFSARGRWIAGEKPAATAGATVQSAGPNWGPYWIAGAVIAGSIIVALVLIGLFS